MPGQSQLERQDQGILPFAAGEKDSFGGIFAGNLDTGSLEEAIPALEKRSPTKFPLISSYTEMDWNFPLDEARQLTREGRILQYAHHFSRWTEEVGMGKEAPILDIYRGKRTTTCGVLRAKSPSTVSPCCSG